MSDSQSNGVSGVSGANGADRADDARAAAEAMAASPAQAAAESAVEAATRAMGVVDPQALAQAVMQTPVEMRQAVMAAVEQKLNVFDNAKFEAAMADLSFAPYAAAPDVTPRAWEGFNVSVGAELGFAQPNVTAQFGGANPGVSMGLDVGASVRGVGAAISTENGVATYSAPLSPGGLVTGVFSSTPGPEGAIDRLGVQVGRGVTFGGAVDLGSMEPSARGEGAWRDRDETGRTIAAGSNHVHSGTSEFGQKVTSTIQNPDGTKTTYSTSRVANDPNHLDSLIYGRR